MIRMTDLEKARQLIDEADREIARQFEKRMDAARLVAAYKKERGLPILDADREKTIIERNREWIADETYRAYYVPFMEQTMAVSRALQSRLMDGMRVAFSGVEGAFADIAAGRIFPEATTIPHKDFKAAYDAVVNSDCDCAVLPLENSYNGDVGAVMDLAFFGPLHINGMFDIAIEQNLLAVKGTTMDEIKTVISHPQALGQCADYIREHGFDTVEAVNTAVAAKQVAESGRHDIAAIGSDEAAQKYGLKKLEARINKSSQNTTRFAVFSRTPKSNSPRDSRFILLFTVKNEAGSLGQAISVIGSHGFNLRALKSRPTRDLIWSYYFYAEGEGNIASDDGKKMLEELRTCCDQVRIIASFEKEIVL